MRKELNYNELVTRIKNHYAPKTSVHLERHKFRECRQAESRSINKYIIELQELVTAVILDLFFFLAKLLLINLYGNCSKVEFEKSNKQ